MLGGMIKNRVLFHDGALTTEDHDFNWHFASSDA
jgi:hypothetical protein